MAVVGFDDIPAAAHFHPPLTTVQQDTRRAAQMLVENLMRRLAGEPVESELIMPQLVVRASRSASPAAASTQELPASRSSTRSVASPARNMSTPPSTSASMLSPPKITRTSIPSTLAARICGMTMKKLKMPM